MERWPRGRPAAIHAWQRVRQAATSRARLARTHVIEIGMPESCALPRALDMGIEPDAHEAARHLVGELGVIAGGDPDAADRQPRHLGGTEDAVLPEGRREGGGNGRAVELVAEVVDQQDGRHLAQLCGDALAPFLVITAFSHHAGAGTGEDGGDRVHHQRGAGAWRGLLDQMQRRRPIDHRAHKAQEQQRHAVGHLRGADEGKVAEEILADERPGLGDLLPAGRSGMAGTAKPDAG